MSIYRGFVAKFLVLTVRRVATKFATVERVNKVQEYLATCTLKLGKIGFVPYWQAKFRRPFAEIRKFRNPKNYLYLRFFLTCTLLASKI